MPPIILQSVVEQVAQKLILLHKHNEAAALLLTPSVIRSAEETYRLLQARARVGSLGAGDSAERRAACVLERAVRRRTTSTTTTNSSRGDSAQPTKLTWKDWGRAVQVHNPSQLEQLQQVLFNYLMAQPSSALTAITAAKSSVTSKSISVQDRHPATTTVSSSRSLRQRMHKLNYKEPSILSGQTATTTTTIHSQQNQPLVGCCYKPQILPHLVIRLAGQFVNPHGLQEQAQQLLHRLHYGGSHHQSFHSAAERRGHWYDLQRYAAAYEAAALYCVATTAAQPNPDNTAMAGGRAPKQHQPRRRKRRASSSRNRRLLAQQDRALNDDEDGDDPDQEGNEQDQCEMDAFSSTTSTSSKAPLLQLSDLVDAGAGEFTYLELRQVLPRVRQEFSNLLAELSSQKLSSSVLETPATSNSHHNACQDGTTQHRHKTNPKKRPWQLAVSDGPTNTSDQPRSLASSPRSNPTAATCTTTTSTTTATKNHEAGNNTATPVLWSAVLPQVRIDDNTRAEREALALAAQQVLHKYGLLQLAG